MMPLTVSTTGGRVSPEPPSPMTRLRDDMAEILSLGGDTRASDSSFGNDSCEVSAANDDSCEVSAANDTLELTPLAESRGTQASKSMPLIRHLAKAATGPAPVSVAVDGGDDAGSASREGSDGSEAGKENECGSVIARPVPVVATASSSSASSSQGSCDDVVGAKPVAATVSFGSGFGSFGSFGARRALDLDADAAQSGESCGSRVRTTSSASSFRSFAEEVGESEGGEFTKSTFAVVPPADPSAMGFSFSDGGASDRTRTVSFPPQADTLRAPAAGSNGCQRPRSPLVTSGSHSRSPLSVLADTMEHGRAAEQPCADKKKKEDDGGDKSQPQSLLGGKLNASLSSSSPSASKPRPRPSPVRVDNNTRPSGIAGDLFDRPAPQSATTVRPHAQGLHCFGVEERPVRAHRSTTHRPLTERSKSNFTGFRHAMQMCPDDDEVAEISASRKNSRGSGGSSGSGNGVGGDMPPPERASSPLLLGQRPFQGRRIRHHSFSAKSTSYNTVPEQMNEVYLRDQELSMSMADDDDDDCDLANGGRNHNRADDDGDDDDDDDGMILGPLRAGQHSLHLRFGDRDEDTPTPRLDTSAGNEAGGVLSPSHVADADSSDDDLVLPTRSRENKVLIQVPVPLPLPRPATACGFTAPSPPKEDGGNDLTSPSSSSPRKRRKDSHKLSPCVSSPGSPEFASPYARRVPKLPPLERKDASHPDLNCISAATLQRAMQGDFGDKVTQLVVIDARFPYEFNGGHIKGAVNLVEESDIDEYFFNNKMHDENTVLVFHCEFSSHRGPRLARHLREKDRRVHINSYPELSYPEVYILQSGYKNFFEQFPDHCHPKSYVPMRDREFRSHCIEGLRTMRRQSSKRRLTTALHSRVLFENDA